MKSKEKGGRRYRILQLQKQGRKSNREEKAQHNFSRNIIPDREGSANIRELFINGATAKKSLPKISGAQYLITEFNIANASLCNRDTLCPCKISWIRSNLKLHLHC